MAREKKFFSELLALQNEAEIRANFILESDRLLIYRKSVSELILSKFYVLSGLVESTKTTSPNLVNHLTRILASLKAVESLANAYCSELKKVFKIIFQFTNPRNLVFGSIMRVMTPDDKEKIKRVMSVKDLVDMRALLSQVLDSLSKHQTPGSPEKPLLAEDLVTKSLELTRFLIDSINAVLAKAAKNPLRGMLRSTTIIELPVSEGDKEDVMTRILPYFSLFLFALTDTFLRQIDEEMFQTSWLAIFYFREICFVVTFAFLFIYNQVLNVSLSRAVLLSSILLALGTGLSALFLGLQSTFFLAISRCIVATGGPVLISRRYLVDLENNYGRTRASAMYNFAFMLGTAFAYFFVQFVHTSSRLDVQKDLKTYVGVIAALCVLWVLLSFLAWLNHKEPQIKHSDLDSSFSFNAWLLLGMIFILSTIYFFKETIIPQEGAARFSWSKPYSEAFLAAFYTVVAPLNIIIAIGSSFIMDRRFVLLSIWISAVSLLAMLYLQQTSFILGCITVLFAYDIIRGPAYSLYSKMEPYNPALRASIIELLAFIVAEALAKEQTGFEYIYWGCIGCLVVTLAAYHFEKLRFHSIQNRAKVA